MKLILYSNGSEKSLAARQFLQEYNILFEEVDARSSDGFQRLVNRTQQKQLPAFELKRAHSIQIIVGFDKELLLREIGPLPLEEKK